MNPIRSCPYSLLLSDELIPDIESFEVEEVVESCSAAPGDHLALLEHIFMRRSGIDFPITWDEKEYLLTVHEKTKLGKEELGLCFRSLEIRKCDCQCRIWFTWGGRIHRIEKSQKFSESEITHVLGLACRKSREETKTLNALANRQQQIAPDKLLFLSRALQKEGFISEEVGAYLSYLDPFMMVRMAGDSIKIRVNREGKVTAIFYRGDCLEKIPDKFVQTINRIGENAMKEINRYYFKGEVLKAVVLLKSIDDMPLYHLKMLAGMIDDHEPDGDSLRIKIFFRDHETLEIKRGNDTGGIFRQYMQRLFEAVKTVENGKITADVHYNIGVILMHCYRATFYDQNPYALGFQYEQYCYRVMLEFSGEQLLQAGFSTLNLKTQLEIYQLIAGDDSKIIGALKQNPPNRIKGAQMELLANFAGMWNKCLKNGNFSHHLAHSNIKQIKESAKKRIHQKYREEASALFWMAQGAFNINRFEGLPPKDAWEIFKADVTAKKFQDYVHGDIEIADRIVFLGDVNDEVKKKTAWLKEWLSDQKTSEKDVRDFIHFVTGGEALPENGKMYVVSRDHLISPLPSTHTCNYQVELSPKPSMQFGCHDRNKRGFIASLKLAMGLAGDGFEADEVMDPDK